LCSIETSVDFQRTTGRYIPEDINILNICWLLAASMWRRVVR
jgi:hypothetical protein